MAVPIKYPMLERPNNGYDENDLWNGMTPEEVEADLKEIRLALEPLHREWLIEAEKEWFENWTPSGSAS